VPLLGLATLAVTAAEFGYGRSSVPLRVRPTGTLVPQVYSTLATMAPGTVVKVPVQPCAAISDVVENESLYLQTRHWQPIAVATLDLQPRSAPMVRSLIAALPDPRAVEALRQAVGLRYVVVHLAELDIDERRSWRQVDGLRLVAIEDQVLLFATTADPPAKIDPAAGTASSVTGVSLAPVAVAGRAAELQVESDGSASIGFPMRARVIVTNRSTARWPGVAVDANRAVMVGVRWRDASGRVVTEVPQAARIPADLGLGETVGVDLCIRPPSVAGRYTLVAGLIQQGEWFPVESAPEPIDIGQLSF